MAKVSTVEKIVVDRDYTDGYAIKNTALTTLGEKYFGEATLAGLNVGELGFTLEQDANAIEDAMNTASVLINEAFPNKAVIPESIYSHAAIHQLDNSFARAGECTFVLLLQQSDIHDYGSENSANGTRTFYIAKETVITVEDIPFTLDYDIIIEEKKKNNTGTYEAEYIYSAKYDMSTKNTISDITNPYLKLRKVGNGLLMLEVTCHQVERTEMHESIITNTKINYPVLEFEFTDTLDGFDIFYKAPTDSDYTALEKRVKFSLPTKSPFCYYRLKDDQTLEITFSAKDGYFQPDFNSDIKVITYTTKGADGNFEEYNGKNVGFQMNNERFDYNEKMIIAGKVVSPCAGGAGKLSLDALQALTVEAFSTATELSTESDISTYFYNYKYRYDNEIFVLKRRDDITERLFSAFLLIKRDDFIYPTNTLYLNINGNEFDLAENSNVYTLNPGHLFVYDGDSRNSVRMLPRYMSYDKTIVDHLFKDRYETGEIWFTDNVWEHFVGTDEDRHVDHFFMKADDSMWRQYDTNGNIISYAEYTDDDMTKENGLIQMLSLVQKSIRYRTETITIKHYVDIDGTYYLSDGTHYSADGEKIDGDISTDTLTSLIESETVTLDIISKQVYYRCDENGDIVNDEYIGYEKYAKDISMYNMHNVGQYYVEDTNGYSRYDWDGNKLESRIDFEDIRPDILSGKLEKKSGYQFIYTNPFLISMSKNPNLVGLYKNIQNQITTLEYVSANDEIASQFITSKLKLNRRIEENRSFDLSLSIIPSIELPDGYVYTMNGYKNTNTGKLNDVRVFAEFYDNKTVVGYLELFPTEVDVADSSMVTFANKVITNNYVTINKTFAVMNLVTGTNNTASFVPIEACKINIYICWRDGRGDVQPKFFDYYRPVDDKGNPTTGGDIDQYSIVNIYSTTDEGLTFIEPLNMMRSTVTFTRGSLNNDGTEDCLLCNLSLLPMVKADMVNNADTFDTFITRVTDNYRYLEETNPRLRNNTNLDVKFYNTYGRSNNYYIGDDKELIDRVNISISYDVKLVDGVTATSVATEIKNFIKEFVEKVNSSGTNDLYISNMIKSIENNFASVHHLRFTGINNYDPRYQTVCMKVSDLNDLTKDELRQYVPEVLVVSTDDINLNVEVVKTLS